MFAKSPKPSCAPGSTASRIRGLEGVEEELGLDEPIEEDFDGLFR